KVCAQARTEELGNKGPPCPEWCITPCTGNAPLAKIASRTWRLSSKRKLRTEACQLPESCRSALRASSRVRVSSASRKGLGWLDGVVSAMVGSGCGSSVGACGGSASVEGSRASGGSDAPGGSDGG